MSLREAVGVGTVYMLDLYLQSYLAWSFGHLNYFVQYLTQELQ